MSNVRFNLTNVTEKNALIRVVFRYGIPSQRLAYSTEENVLPQYWDNDKLFWNLAQVVISGLLKTRHGALGKCINFEIGKPALKAVISEKNLKI